MVCKEADCYSERAEGESRNLLCAQISLRGSPLRCVSPLHVPLERFGRNDIKRRHGSVYIIVLASAMIVTIIGLGSLFAARVQRRSAQVSEDCAEARLCAQSAIELGLLFVKDQNWRSNWPNGTWLSNQQLGNGCFSLEGIDPRDGDLADSLYDPVVLTGIGTKGIAKRKVQVVLTANIKPLLALNTCLHASGNIYVWLGQKITAVGAPISTNGCLYNLGTIEGDVEAVNVGSTGYITGHLTTPAAVKRMPDSQVISQYIDKATVVPFTDTIDKQVLTPSYNPWGSTNADGVYFIDTSNNDLTIKNSRIHGTLIVRLGDKKLTLDEAVFMHSYRSYYPVLIVDGKVKIKCRSDDYNLSETSCSTNYNPSGAPYLGVWDSDKYDSYPNEIQGLVYIKGTLELEKTARIRGAIICEGEVSCKERNKIIHEPKLYTSPPDEFTFVDGVQLSPGSCKQVVD